MYTSMRTGMVASTSDKEFEKQHHIGTWRTVGIPLIGDLPGPVPVARMPSVADIRRGQQFQPVEIESAGPRFGQEASD